MIEVHVEVGAAGDFHYQKEFEVKLGKKGITEGCIVQLVTKVTRVNVHGGRILTESEEISEFTRNKANFMTFNYIELFEYQKANKAKGYAAGWQRDQFQNGAVVPYDSKGKPVIVTNETKSEHKYATSGTITMRGDVMYIPDKDKAIRDGHFEIGAGNHPANGLQVTTPAYWDVLKALRASPIITHNVSISWVMPSHPANSFTTLKSTFNDGEETIKKSDGGEAYIKAQKAATASGAAGGATGVAKTAKKGPTAKTKGKTAAGGEAAEGGRRKTRRRRSPQ